MSVLTLRPNADDGTGELATTPAQSAGNHYNNIDEETLSESDYNYVSTASQVSGTDRFGLPNHSSESDTINKVTVKCYCKEYVSGTPSGHATAKLLVKISSTVYNGSTQNLTTSTSLYSQEWTTNPATSSAWTWDEIDALIVGITLANVVSGKNTAEPRVFQLWVEVTYGEEEGQTLTLDLADTVNLSDVIVKAAGLNKADTANLSDARVKDIGLAKADTANISDAPAKAFSMGEIADTVNLTDAMIKEAGLNKADTFYVSDADDGSCTLGITKAIGLNKADTVNISDAIIKDMGKAFADEVSLSDLIDLVLNGGGTALELSLDDTVYFSDGIIKLYEKPLRDEVEFSDALAKAFSMGEIADEIEVSDGISKEPQINQADSITLADVISSKAIGLNKADTVNISDTPAKAFAMGEIADGVDISDAIVKDVSKGIIADTVNISDEISKEAELNKADNIEIEDALTTKNIGLNKSDTVNISDAIVKDMNKAFDDVVYISDLIDVVLNEVGEALELFLSDTVTFSDVIAKSYEKPLQDEVKISDDLAKEFGKVVSDIIEFSDSIAKSVNLALSDTTLLSDSVARHLGKTLADGITAADQIRKAIGKVLQDAAYFSDVCLPSAITAETFKSMVTAVQRVRQVCGQLTKRVREVTSRARIREVVCIPIHLRKEDDMELLVFDPKQSWEEYYVAFNFARDITPGTIISVATVIVTDAAGTVVTDTLTDSTQQLIAGSKVLIWARGGSEQIYKFTCRITMSNGEKFEQDATMEVAEV